VCVFLHLSSCLRVLLIDVILRYYLYFIYICVCVCARESVSVRM